MKTKIEAVLDNIKNKITRTEREIAILNRIKDEYFNTQLEIEKIEGNKYLT